MLGPSPKLTTGLYAPGNVSCCLWKVRCFHSLMVFCSGNEDGAAVTLPPSLHRLKAREYSQLAWLNGDPLYRVEGPAEHLECRGRVHAPFDGGRATDRQMVSSPGAVSEQCARSLTLFGTYLPIWRPPSNHTREAYRTCPSSSCPIGSASWGMGAHDSTITHRNRGTIPPLASAFA